MAALVSRHGGDKEVMQKAGWKIDQNEEACYIDIEVDNEDGPEETQHSYSDWNNLPDILLEDIFKHLNVRERYYASLVCWNWYHAFYLPTVWNNFIVDDNTLTRPKYNYYSGWQYCLDHMRTQNCLARIGKYLRGVEFRPEHSFNNIYQFMTMLSWSMEKASQANAPRELVGVGSRIRSLVYYFPCNMSQANDPEGIKLFGTGGQLLKALKDLLSKLTELRILKLTDFVLERFEANHLLDEVLEVCFTKLRVLNVVNVTTEHCPILHVGLFVNLQVLTISPQNINDEVLQLLASSKVKHLCLLQNRYTSSYLALTACSAKAWRKLRAENPQLRVHLRVESLADGEVVFQPEAPVFSVTYCAPKIQVKTDVLLRMVDNYKTTLSVYGHEMLPRYSSSKSFHNRIDGPILLLCRQAFNMSVLTIREKISSATVLLIATTAKNLAQLNVRRNAVILRCDWPRNPDWTDQFYEWLRRMSRSYDSVESEVSAILSNPHWHMLSDVEFKQIQINTMRDF